MPARSGSKRSSAAKPAEILLNLCNPISSSEGEESGLHQQHEQRKSRGEEHGMSVMFRFYIIGDTVPTYTLRVHKTEHAVGLDSSETKV